MTPLHQKQQARAKIASALAPTVYHEPWWLDAASDGGYQEATVEAGGSMVGRLPYVALRKTRWQTALVMPAMTHLLGPAVTGSSTRQLSITRELLAQLPPASHVWFRLHPGIVSTLAFDSAGFGNGVDFTVRIAPDRADALWERMRDKTRNVIRRAEERLSVVEWRDPGKFLDFYEDNLRARGQRNVYDRRLCAAVIASSVGRGRGRISVAADPGGVPKAAIFTVWDGSIEYYHMSTRATHSTNGATSLLVWNAIRHAAGNDLAFDMDGVNTQTNLSFVTGFGGTIAPRFLVCRSSASFRLAHWGKSLLGA